MKKIAVSLIVAAVLVGGYAFGTGFTDVNSSAYWGKTDIPKLTEKLDGNFTQLEAGTVDIRVETVTVDSTATFSGAVNVSGAVTFSGNMSAANISTTGTLTIAEGALTDSKVVEADLKVVDSPSDEDFLSYESTTGDFEWHSAAEIAGKFTEGVLADSIVVTADIKDGTILNADISGSANIDAAKLLSGSTITAINGASITNMNASSLASGTVANTLLDSDLQDLADGSLTASKVAAGYDASGLLAGSTASAINGASITNLSANNLASGTVANTLLDSDLQDLADGSLTASKVASGYDSANLLAGSTCSAINGASITNLNASNLASGTVGNTLLDTDLQDLADGSLTASKVAAGYDASGLLAGSTASAINGASITNLNASTLLSGTVPNARLDADLGILAGITGAENQFIYFSGAGTGAVATVTAAARSILDDASVGAIAATIAGGTPITRVATGVVWKAGAATSNWTIVNGLITSLGD